MCLLLCNFLDLGDMLAEFIAALLSSLSAFLISLSDVLLDLFTKQKISLLQALLSLHCSPAAFLLNSWRHGSTSAQEDLLALLLCTLELVGDVCLADLRRRCLRVGLETLLNLWHL